MVMTNLIFYIFSLLVESTTIGYFLENITIPINNEKCSWTDFYKT